MTHAYKKLKKTSLTKVTFHLFFLESFPNNRFFIGTKEKKLEKKTILVYTLTLLMCEEWGVDRVNLLPQDREGLSKG